MVNIDVYCNAGNNPDISLKIKYQHGNLFQKTIQLNNSKAYLWKKKLFLLLVGCRKWLETLKPISNCLLKVLSSDLAIPSECDHFCLFCNLFSDCFYAKTLKYIFFSTNNLNYFFWGGRRSGRGLNVLKYFFIITVL